MYNNYDDSMEFFHTEPCDLYEIGDKDRLLDMCKTLYSDKEPWYIIERPTGLYVCNDNISIHYLEFIFKWIIPTLFMSVITSTSKNKNKLDVYIIDRYESVDYTGIYELLFNSYNIIQACYDYYKQVVDNNSLSQV